ncbi:MAG: diacylglycerol kinase family protein [Candidatus Izemoplasmatales bacterium]|jgi:diacylglycerol kinase family enzyme|nr:diacylglycerol kinase family protein [Candidatus Izemoplasmatales bacterium]
MLLIVHNPLSNNRKSKKTTNKWVRFFKRHKVPFTVRSTLKIDDLNAYLVQHDNITDLLYLGGDGSINYLINNMDISKIKQNIYLSKSGSGNDYLRSLKQVKDGEVILGEASTNVGKTKFINGCGIGFDALVVYYVNNDSRKSKISYFLNVFKAVFKYDRSDLEVVVDEKEYMFHNTYFIAIQNGKYFGGGMKVTPKGDPTKDTFQICIAHSLNAAILLSLFSTIYLGLHPLIKKKITMLEGKVISVKVPSPRYLQADGEVLENVQEMTVTKSISKKIVAFNKRNFLKQFKATAAKK